MAENCPYKDKAGACMAKPEQETVIHKFLREQRLIKPKKDEAAGEMEEFTKKRKSLSDYFKR